jgi:hypothetical protein
MTDGPSNEVEGEEGGNVCANPSDHAAHQKQQTSHRDQPHGPGSRFSLTPELSHAEPRESLDDVLGDARTKDRRQKEQQHDWRELEEADV